ncbi:hypothetical protein ACTHPH_04525 [Paenibacillus pasadenensis]|uniref:Uncharacterized protein n=1 Tax=Paenibacillus pasadenensis TaxID=217090 RepID=A0A2N5N1U5_9BACL|nr:MULTISPECIES: hypothetical protein [Paenibacillus]PLT44311.1 hypothetical protein B8V81_2742 [Paenibacillus pasadenensis]QGG54823.1 hypothetical protein GE073_03965 [Paenibacillus sp. B01]
MRTIDELEHTARVHTVIEVVKEVLGDTVLTDEFIASLRRMSFEELGQFVLRLVTTRELDAAFLAVSAMDAEVQQQQLGFA